MTKRVARSLRLNGKPVRTIGSQMVVDYFDLEFDLEPEPPRKKRPKCTCGAHAAGHKPYMAGHSEWCDVHEDKTPVGMNNLLYEEDYGST